jgi:hypothetical protein
MMLRTLAPLLLALGCGSSNPPFPAPATPGGNLEHGMANCPSAILGSTTTVADAPDGVTLTITATEPAARQRVRDLATLQATQGDPTATEARHTGRHGGPGIEGHCPIIHEGTVVTATPTDDGVAIHVATTTPDRVQMLQAETRERVAKTATIAHHP